MGRPKDDFAWLHVDLLSERVRKCKYCGKVFQAEGTRINKHLSTCLAAPEDIQIEATRRKGGQNSSVQDPSPSTSNRQAFQNSSVQDPSLSTSNRQAFQNSSIQDPSLSTSGTQALTGLVEEFVSQPLVKWLMLNTSSPVTDHFVDNAYLKDFIVQAHKYGLPLSLCGGDSDILAQSDLKMTHEVDKNVSLLEQSWKATGCTLMVFNREYFSTKLERDMCVVALYCPKGIIFVEAPHPDTDFEGFRRALRRHRKRLEFDDVVTNVKLRHYSYCHQVLDDLARNREAESLLCFRYEIQEICIDTCWESQWAKRLIDKAVKHHEQICAVQSLRPGYYAISKEDGVLENTKRKAAYNLSTFLSIIRLRGELKPKLDEYISRRSLGSAVAQPLEHIYNDCSFWKDGWELYHVLAYILEVSEQMEALVPTSGYLAMAIERVTNRLNADDKEQNLSLSGDLLVFWKKIESKLRGTIEGSCREAASYLNPVYYVQQLQGIQNDDLQLQLQFQEKVKKALIKYIFTDFNRAKKLLDLGNQYGGQFVDEDGDWGNFVAEVQRYYDVFNHHFELNNRLGKLYHPLKLWEMFGNDLLLLQKCAIRLLSKPVNCMCKQVKKHMDELKGDALDPSYILRLNLKMIEHFKALGDGINKPIHFPPLL